MTKLEKLIEELCPNGIAYKVVADIAEISIGEFVHKSKQSLNGEYPVFNGGTSNTGFYDDYNRTANKIIISARGANAGFVNRVFTNYWSGNSCYTVDVVDKNMDWTFVYYWFKSKEKVLLGEQQKGGIPAVSKKQVENFRVPVPPLEVQAEIVKILDDYSTSVTALQQEIEKELTARKKQYKYYLNSFFDEIKADKVALSSLGSLKRGKRFVHADDTDSGVPCIHYGELYTYYGVYADTVKTHIREELRDKMRYATTGDVVIVGAGENNIDIGVGVAWLGNHDIAIHDACYTLHHKQNPKYVSYFLRTDMYHNQIKKYVYEGKICSISAENVGKALIPLPPLHEQKRIVQILDRFDKLCNDISEVLPAEIEARRKQYEYYRDKLLTFKELTV